MSSSESSKSSEAPSVVFNEPTAKKYPYVTVRVHACVYMPVEIRFLSPDDEPIKESSTVWSVVAEKPSADGVLTPEVEEILVQKVMEKVQSHGFRMCLVLSKERSIYCEPDGSSHENTQAPSGGIPLHVDYTKKENNE